MAGKQTKVSRVTTEDLTAAWIIEHKAAAALLLAVLLGLAFACGVLAMESQLAHAGLW
jgi:hypothetical protein